VESTQKRTRCLRRRAVWDYILQEFAGQKQLAIPNWALAVGPSFGPNATLPTVRETPFWREFFHFKRSFYQDKLGTNRIKRWRRGVFPADIPH